MIADISVVGHITRDIVRIRGRERVQAGGVAYYAALAAAALGASVTVLTRVAEKDRETLLADVRQAGITVHARPSARTTSFVNEYPAPGAARIQQVLDAADPIGPNDLGDQEDKTRAWYFGPLTPDDLMPEGLAHAGRLGGMIALDAQGLLRRIESGRVSPGSNAELPGYLRNVDMLKMSDEEARVAVGTDSLREAVRALSQMGPAEIIVTRDEKGSLIYHADQFVSVGAARIDTVIDPTGCGDTYFAAYLWWRLQGNDPEAAGRFASAASALKATRAGALRANVEEVLRFARNVQTGSHTVG